MKGQFLISKTSYKYRVVVSCVASSLTQQCSDWEFVSALAGLTALAAARCSFDFVTRCARTCEDSVWRRAMFSEVVFGDGKVRGTRYFLSGVAPIGLELLLIASLLLCSGRTRAFCSVIRQAAEERVHHRVRTPSHAESALAFVFSILMPCCSCLAICVLLCRLPPVLRHHPRHRPCDTQPSLRIKAPKAPLKRSRE